MNRQGVFVFVAVFFLAILLSMFAIWGRGGGTTSTDKLNSFVTFVPDDPALIARHNEAVGLIEVGPFVSQVF